MPVSEYSQGTDRTADVRTQDQTPFGALVVDHPELLRGLTDCGFASASPIQVAALPAVIAGNDVIVEAKNGTGKTLTFVVPALIRLKADQSHLQSVVLAPTREIAVQIQQCFKKVGQHLTGLKCEYFIGGTPFEEDKQKANGCQIAVGTPGRIKHLLTEHVLKGSEVKIFIIDEVDRLFTDQNFTKDVRLINAKFPKIKQMIAVSASIDKKDMSLFDEFMKEYSIIKGSEEDMNESEDPSKFLLGIKQYVACVKAVSTNIILLPAKNVRLLNILQNLNYTQCLVFTNYMTRAEAICNMLRDHNYKADYIRGDQDQNIRLKLVDRLTSFKSKILVATDLISRGIDSSNVDLVINMDCPHDWATYLHRIGRAGRFGNKGFAFSILDDDKELKTFKRIINKIENVKIKMLPLAIEKPILEYADGELEDLDLTCSPYETEENKKEIMQDDSAEVKPKEIESNIICQQQIVNNSSCVSDASEEESIQKLRQVVIETEKKLIDNNMVDKKYLNSDRSFVLFDPESLLTDTGVNYSTQELIDMFGHKDIEESKTEGSSLSEKDEHTKNVGDQLHNTDTILNVDEQTQNRSVSQNDSGVGNFIPDPTVDCQQQIVNNSMRVPAASDEELSEQDYLIDDDKYSNSLDLEPLITSSTGVSYSTQELIDMTYESNQSIKKLHNTDTILIADEKIQKHPVSQRDSGVRNYIPGTWTKIQLQNILMSAQKPPRNMNVNLNGDQTFTNLNEDSKTESTKKIDEPRFKNVCDLFQIPDFSLLKETNTNNSEVNSASEQSADGHAMSKETCGESSTSCYSQEENITDDCEEFSVEDAETDDEEVEMKAEEESEVKVESDVEEESEGELYLDEESAYELELEDESLVQVEPNNENENDDDCITDENENDDDYITDENENDDDCITDERKNENVEKNTNYDKDDQSTNSPTKRAEKLVIQSNQSFQGTSSATPETEVHQTDSVSSVNRQILNGWYSEWLQQLGIIRTYANRNE